MPATHADHSPTSESPSDETDNTQERRSLGVAGCALRFDQSLAESRSAQELVDKMMVLRGDLGNPYTLWTAAQGVFEQGQGASS